MSWRKKLFGRKKVSKEEKELKKRVELIQEQLDKGWWKDQVSKVKDSDEQFMVIAPRGDAPLEFLESLGQVLQKWQKKNKYVAHIWGLSDLLNGHPPRTPPIYLCVPYSGDFSQCYEAVALIFVRKGTNYQVAGKSLQEAIKEHAEYLAWNVDPGNYSYWNR